MFEFLKDHMDEIIRWACIVLPVTGVVIWLGNQIGKKPK